MTRLDIKNASHDWAVDHSPYGDLSMGFDLLTTGQVDSKRASPQSKWAKKQRQYLQGF
jgi:hypothetical protein